MTKRGTCRKHNENLTRAAPELRRIVVTSAVGMGLCFLNNFWHEGAEILSNVTVTGMADSGITYRSNPSQTASRSSTATSDIPLTLGHASVRLLNKAETHPSSSAASGPTYSLPASNIS